MPDSFHGTLSGNGLTSARISGDMEAEKEADGITVRRHHGRFLWSGSHRFAADEQYHLDLDDGRFYDILITSVGPGAGPGSSLVKFQTVS
jgi:hypothetical protein